MARPRFERLSVLLGLLWLGCTSDLPVVPPPLPPPAPPPPPASPVKVAFDGEPQGGSTDAALAPFRVALLDAHDSVLARDSINITLRLVANHDSATLRGTLTVPTRAGIAEFRDVWIDHAAQGYRVIAEASTLSSDTSSAFSMVTPRPFDRSVIAANRSSTCALDPSGAAWCWGDNVVGQLGEGRVLSSKTPVPIGGNLRFSRIVVYPGKAGVIDGAPWEWNEKRKIACGLTVSGVIYCWGGAGSTFGDGGTPKAISGSRTFSSIGIGANDDGVCGLASDGTVWCWKNGAENGPTQVATNLRFVSLSSGSGKCGLTAAGKAYCWGRGYLGNGQFNTSDTVVAVSGDHVFRAIASGWSHYAGIDDSGVAWTWGYGDRPFLGDGSGARQALVPVRVPGDHDFRSINAGYRTCAIDGDGRLWCWGDTVTPGSGVPKFAMVSLAADVRVGSCALTPDGEAWCGGARVETTERFAWISTGDRATCAITTEGEGRCWGSNYAGQLADGHPLRSPVPLRVVGGKTFESLSGGGSAMCGLTTSDETWCWGPADSVGERSTPTRLVGDPRLKTVSLANGGGCGIDANRQGWCWGDGRVRATGDSYLSAGKPVQILGNIRLSAVAVGVQACALTTGGDVYCAGPGIGTSWSLTLLPGGRKFVALSGGLEVHCALTAAGDAYCWTYFDHRPILLPGGLRLATISADGLADGGLACGVTTEGKGYCWRGSGGYLSPYVLHAPEPVPGDLTFTRIEVSHEGGRHVCGTTAEGTIYCWGSNSRGQLGNGKIDDVTVTVPTPVVGLKARH